MKEFYEASPDIEKPEDESSSKDEKMTGAMCGEDHLTFGCEK